VAPRRESQCGAGISPIGQQSLAGGGGLSKGAAAFPMKHRSPPGRNRKETPF
jgi:hypothetical protein